MFSPFTVLPLFLSKGSSSSLSLKKSKKKKKHKHKDKDVCKSSNRKSTKSLRMNRISVSHSSRSLLTEERLR